MSDWRKLDTIANVTIIATGILVSSLILRNWVESARAQAERQPYRAGESLGRVESLDLSASRTVLLVVRSNCHFCTQSMPFYKRLSDLRRQEKASFRLVALTTEPVATGEHYLSENGVSVDRVL